MLIVARGIIKIFYKWQRHQIRNVVTFLFWPRDCVQNDVNFLCKSWFFDDRFHRFFAWQTYRLQHRYQQLYEWEHPHR